MRWRWVGANRVREAVDAQPVTGSAAAVEGAARLVDGDVVASGRHAPVRHRVGERHGAAVDVCEVDDLDPVPALADRIGVVIVGLDVAPEAVWPVDGPDLDASTSSYILHSTRRSNA